MGRMAPAEGPSARRSTAARPAALATGPETALQRTGGTSLGPAARERVRRHQRRSGAASRLHDGSTGDTPGGVQQAGSAAVCTVGGQSARSSPSRGTGGGPGCAQRCDSAAGGTGGDAKRARSGVVARPSALTADQAALSGAAMGRGLRRRARWRAAARQRDRWLQQRTVDAQQRGLWHRRRARRRAAARSRVQRHRRGTARPAAPTAMPSRRAAARSRVTRHWQRTGQPASAWQHRRGSASVTTAGRQAGRSSAAA